MKWAEAQWYRQILLDLHRYYQPTYRQNPSARYRNMDEFVKTGASLAVLVMLSDCCYEEMQLEVPASILQFDLAGSMEIGQDNRLIIEGAEVKSSPNGKKTVKMHFYWP